MIDSVLTALNSPYVVYPAIVISGTVISYKILKIALPAIAKAGRDLYNSTFVMNLRSMVCEKCANLHAMHIFKKKFMETEGQTTPLSKPNTDNSFPVEGFDKEFRT